MKMDSRPKHSRMLATLVTAGWVIILCLAAGKLSWAGSAQNQDAGSKADEVVVRVGDRTITRSTLDLRKKQITMKRRQKPSDKEVEGMVDRMVEQSLFAQEARALKLDQDPQVKMIINETVDKILANLYVRKKLLPAVQVSEADVAEYYKQHRNAWRQPETVRARHILFRVGNQATAQETKAVETRALEIRKRLADGEDFEKLARSYSEDTGTKNKGGDLGFFTRKGKVPAISDTAFALKDGEIGQPVRSSVGYHIIQTIERRPPGVKPLEEVSGEIRSRLQRGKQMAAVKEDRKRLEEKFELYVHESLRLAEKSDEK